MTGEDPPGLVAFDPIWLAGFRINGRKISNYRWGRAFLAGDVAHVQSPAGGQGMNTGCRTHSTCLETGARGSRDVRRASARQLWPRTQQGRALQQREQSCTRSYSRSKTDACIRIRQSVRPADRVAMQDDVNRVEHPVAIGSQRCDGLRYQRNRNRADVEQPGSIFGAIHQQARARTSTSPCIGRETGATKRVVAGMAWC